MRLKYIEDINDAVTFTTNNNLFTTFLRNQLIITQTFRSIIYLG